MVPQRCTIHDQPAPAHAGRPTLSRISRSGGCCGSGSWSRSCCCGASGESFWPPPKGKLKPPNLGNAAGGAAGRGRVRVEVEEDGAPLAPRCGARRPMVLAWVARGGRVAGKGGCRGRGQGTVEA